MDGVRERELRCTCTMEADRTVLLVEGEVDASTVDLLDDWLAAASEIGRPLVLDLSGVPFMDSAGVHALLRARQRGEVTIRGARPIVLRCLELTGLDRLFDVQAPPTRVTRWLV